VCAWRQRDGSAAAAGGGSSSAPPAWERLWVCVTVAPSDARHRQIFCLKVSGGGVFAGASDGAVFCLCAATGNLLWAAGLEPAAIVAQPAAGGAGFALAKHAEDGVRRLDIIDGALFAATQHGVVSRFELAHN